MGNSSMKNLRTIENVLVAKDHDLLIALTQDVVWLKKMFWWILGLLVTSEGLNIGINLWRGFK